MSGNEGELYHTALVALLEGIWGKGFLSPGGPDEIARLVARHDISGKSVLDIGCGAGGVDIALVANHAAGHVCGVDVEDTVIAHARMRIAEAGLTDRIGLAKVAPGPLPFPPRSFEVVFSKDSIVHIPDKHALMADVWRLLKPGGWFIASDWLIGHDHAPSPEMAAYIKSEGLDFGMASPARYRDALMAAGFVDVETRSRNDWYRQTARQELDRMRGPWRETAAAAVGPDFVDHNIEIWELMIRVLDTGEHCPTHIYGRKPG